MAKIRGIKPEFWTDEDIAELSIPARLLFVGLWTFACDNGHLQDKPKQIKMRIMPGDDVNVAELLRELEAAGRIVRADGWITVPNLGAHQKIDARYFTTCIKEGCDDPPAKVSQRESRRVPAVHTSGTHRAHTVRTSCARGDGDGDGDVDSEGDGDGGAGGKRPARKHQLRDDFAASSNHERIANERGVDLAAEVEKFKDHHLAKGSVFKDWDRALNNWLRNAYPSRQASVHQLPTKPNVGDKQDGLTYTVRGWVPSDIAWMQG